MSEAKKRVCVIGAGPCGMSALYHFGNTDDGKEVDVVCYEKQGTWGGLWNFSWRTGNDEFGELCHNGMYKNLWCNSPKETIEFPDYTYEDHFGKAIPSYPPRPVLRDYLEGRWTKSSKADLRKYIQFNTVVRNVHYNKHADNFTVVATNLKTNKSTTETFTHVIVAVGIFNCPNVPYFPGIESFDGRILHSHNFRDASEFKGQRLLVVGSSYSAEDVALMCMKYGAKSAICTWRTKPMGFKWPQGIEERPLAQKFEGKTVHFKDGSSAEVDYVVLCTGYLYSFPFMEDELRLQSSLSMYPDNLYKGTLWVGSGGNKLFYMGIQDQYYSYTIYDAQGLWTCKYILGQMPDEPKPMKEMSANVKEWREKCSKLKSCHDNIDFQTDVLADWCKDTGYPADATKAGKLLHDWENHKVQDIVTYRDQCFTSVFSGTESPKHSVPWWTAYDDSITTFVK